MKIEAAADERHADTVERILRQAQERGDFVQGEDGYTYYWPTNSVSHGFLPAWALRVLADEMDRRDRPWHAVIQGDPNIGPGCLQVWTWKNAPEDWKRVCIPSGHEQWLALVPLSLIDAGLTWMDRENQLLERYKEGAPHGFEIWIGSFPG